MKSYNHLSKSLLIFTAMHLASFGVANAKQLSDDLNDFDVNNSYFSQQSVDSFGSSAGGRWQNRLTQNQQGQLRSRSDVMREVKKRYNAEILRISLSQNGRFYVVRMLMPNGKVRSVQVNAIR